MLYSAIVRKTIIDAARSASGRFFVGSSPNVGSAAQILATAPNYLATKVPAVLIHYPSDAMPLEQWSGLRRGFAGTGLFR